MAEESTLDLTYEEAFAQLEVVLAELERGDLPLEEALARYERGLKLAAFCEQKLDDALLRVRLWQPEGEPLPLTGWQDEG